MLKISACAIVKNEEENLPHWLACVKSLADEIVVVDTGSTDRTAEIAREAGAQVYSFEWKKDFSAAKNFALQKARGNWIVFLDADEFFSEEDIPKVKGHIRRLDKDGRIAGFICPWVNIDVDRGGIFLFEGIQIRVFRRHPEIRYHGAVHEMLQARGGKWKTPTVKDVRILHTGYSSGVVQRKFERNLEILLEERKKRGEIASDAYYLADCYYGLERYEEAIEWARKAIASGYTLVGLETRPYDVLLGAMISLRRPAVEVCEAAEEALKKFPKTPDYKADEGIALWQEKDYARAETYFEAALSMTKEGLGYIRGGILEYLADIAHRRGQDAKALDYAAESLKENRFSTRALSLLCRIFSALPAADVVQFLNTIYDASADAEFLIRILAKNGLYEVCLYYDKKAGGRILSDWERLFFANAYPAAVYEAAHAMARGFATELFAARRLDSTSSRDDTLPEAFLSPTDGGETALSRELQSYLFKLEQVFPAERAHQEA